MRSNVDRTVRREAEARSGITVVQIGWRNDYEVANALEIRALLDLLVTDYSPGWLMRGIARWLVPAAVRSKWAMRVPRDVPRRRTFSAFHIVGFLAQRRLDIQRYCARFHNKCGYEIHSKRVYFLSESFPLASRLKADVKILEIVLSAYRDLEIERKLQSRSPEFSDPKRIRFREGLAELERMSIQSCNRYIFPSDYVFKTTIARYNLDVAHCRVVPYWCPEPFVKQSLRVKSLAPDERLRVAFVGRISMIKGAHLVLKALGSLADTGVDVYFAGNSEIDLKPWLGNPRLSFLGHVNRIALDDLFRRAHVLLLPTHNEGSALVTYQALSYGMPLITTEASGTIAKDQIHGVVKANYEPEDIAAVIEDIKANRSVLSTWSENCLSMAASWKLSGYHDRIACAIDELSSTI